MLPLRHSTIIFGRLTHVLVAVTYHEHMLGAQRDKWSKSGSGSLHRINGFWECSRKAPCPLSVHRCATFPEVREVIK